MAENIHDHAIAKLLQQWMCYQLERIENNSDDKYNYMGEPWCLLWIFHQKILYILLMLCYCKKNSMSILFHCNSTIHGHEIATNICTCHKSTTVLPCAKVCCNDFINKNSIQTNNLSFFFGNNFQMQTFKLLPLSLYKYFIISEFSTNG